MEAAANDNLTLHSTLSAWPVADALARALPVGDLLTLARTSSALRASLHGFPLPLDTNNNEAARPPVRDSIYVGLHQTPEWRSLKEAAPFECSSKTHTKGSKPRPCRLCSTPICEACIVRDSFAHRNENTFKHRTRSFCLPCWQNGNLSKSMRYSGAGQQQLEPDTSHCVCTLMKDGWLCLPCKWQQNKEAQAPEAKTCHGEACDNDVGPDAGSRRLCLWCQRTLPPHLGGASRRAWNQKMIEARKRSARSRMLDLEEYNTKLTRSMKVTRRELRGDEAVKGDPLADLPQFIRDLDVVNYRSLMAEDCVPSPEDIYHSKHRHFRYTRAFLEAARRGSGNVRWSIHFFDYLLQNKADPLQRTNKMKKDEWKLLLRWPEVKGHIASFINDQYWTDENGDANTYLSDALQNKLGPFDPTKYTAFINLKTRILGLLLTEQLRLETTRRLMRINHGFTASREEYILMLIIWSLCPPEALPRDCLERILNEGRRDVETQNQAFEMARMQMEVDDDEDFDYQNSRLHLLDSNDTNPDPDDDGSLLNAVISMKTDGDNVGSYTSTRVDFAELTPDETIGKGKGKAVNMDERGDALHPIQEPSSSLPSAPTQQQELAITTSNAPQDEPPSYENVWTGASNDTMLEITPAEPEGEESDLAPPEVEAFDRSSLGVTG